MIWIIGLGLCACNPQKTPLIETPTLVVAVPTATPVPTPTVVLIAPPPVPSQLSSDGLALIYEYETGGQRQYEHSPHPEFLNDRFSGVTVGIGYDLHQYRATVIVSDWNTVLTPPSPTRLAETQPYSGPRAREPWLKVRDILVPWTAATHIFLENDLAREYASARRSIPGFDDLTPNCQAALLANGFARGYSWAGPTRKNIAAIRALTPKKDYLAIAQQLRAQEVVFRGTKDYNGLRNRFNAEAELCLRP